MTPMDTHLLAAALPALGWAAHTSLLTHRLTTARRDPLTGLHTRDGFTTRADRITRRHPNAAVLLVDLDDFKAVNDTHGHAAGDTVITATAHRLTRWTGAHGITARLGGDEFATALTSLTPTTGLTALREALHRPVAHHGQWIDTSASLGICHLADLPAPTLTDALAAADADMYADKGHGRRNSHH